MTILFDNANGGDDGPDAGVAVDKRTRPPIDSEVLDMAILEQMKAWNPRAPEACDCLVHELVQQRCAERPETPAVCAWNGDLTYLGLNTAATSVAEVLVSQGDIGPEKVVPLYFEKSRWVVVAILAALKAGAAFVLLDPAHPIKRLKEICMSVGAGIIITSPKHAEHASKLVSNILVVDENAVNWEAPPMARSLVQVAEPKPENAAYVAMTSGSTGTPKAVVNTHRSFCTAALGHGALQGLSSSSRVLQFASYAFTTSIREILTTLIFGATICIPSEDDRRESLGDTVEKLRVNWASLSPSVARTLEPDEVPGLETLLLAGEAPTNHDLRKWSPYVKLFCCYGQTECGATSSVYAVSRLDGRPRTIGRGTSGALIWIVDPEDPERLAPVGSVGELLVHGPVVARGYLGGQTKTAQKFIDAPSWMEMVLPASRSSERLFRTGDLGRYRGDGLIEYVARKDTQVKLHGQRLEVEEVEHHLCQCLDQSQDVAVDVITPVDDSESSCLVAFIACSSQRNEPEPWLMAPTDEFRSMAEAAKAQLQQQLPLYMVPTCFLSVRSLPLAASGKLNRRYLREHGNAMTHRELQSHEYRAMTTTDGPTTEMEKTVQNLWAQILHLPVDTIGVCDNFWSLGGNSIRAMKLAGLARRHGLSIQAGDFWAQPTMREMARRVASYDGLDIGLAPFSLLDGGQSQRESLLHSVRQQCGMEESQVDDIYPCTALQAGLIALSGKRPGAYTLAYEYELPADIDIGRLQAAWAATIKANPILRTRIVLGSDGKLYQVVLREHDIPWDTRRSGQAIPSAWQDWQLGQRLIRLALSPGEQPASLTLLLHHTITDGWAISLLLEQVQSAYSGSVLRPQPFNGFIHYLVRRAQMDHFDGFWKQRLSALQACSFPELPSPNYDPIPSATEERVIPLDTTARSERQSLAARLQLSWAAVVATYTDSPDVVFGITVSGRGAPVVGVEDMTGPTIATLPFRLVLSPTETVKAAINRVQAQSAETIPFEQAGLQRINRLGSDAAAACRFQSLLVIQPTREKSPAIFANRSATLLPYATSSYAITLNCWLNPSHLTVIATFDPNVISQIQVQRMLNQMRHAFQQITPSSNQPWGNVDLLSPDDVTQLHTWNPKLSMTDEQCAHEVIQDKALAQPHAPAVCAWDGGFSYQELDSHASRLAYTLMARGVGPESLVPLYFEKTRWILVAILGVLKAGGAFVLMDTAHPLERLRNICTDAEAHLVLTSPARQGKATSLGPATLVIGDQQADWMAENYSGVPNGKITPDTAMYAVFTSGSTGKPKCVVIEHRNFMASVNDKIAAYGVSSKSRVLQFCSYAFDVATFELLITLLAGACICIPSEDEQRDQLGPVTTMRQATIAYMTPTLARALDPKDFPTLQTLVLGGEPVSREELRRWRKKDLRVSYGPAECTVTSSSGRLSAEGTGVGYIGFPLGCRFWITDSEDPERLLPVGATGELLIEGPRVGRGYLNAPDTIARAFMNPPTWLKALHARCHVVYRTGDLVRYNGDGSLTYVGRKDRQVKIRGQRIELGEIEYHARQAFPSIQDVVAEVICLERGHRSPSVVVFILLDRQHSSIQEDLIVPSADEDFLGCIDTLRPQLENILPASMVPQKFIPITRVPLSTNGKLDRLTLREHASRLSREDLAKYSPGGTIKRQPVTDSQRALQTVFAQILSVPVDAIGIDDHFFRLGGDSISAMQLASVALEVGYRVSGSDIFLYPTVKGLAERAISDENTWSDEGEIPPFSLIPVDLEAKALILSAASQCELAPDQIEDIYPCTAIQEGVTALATRSSGSYVASVVYDVKDEADMSRLQAAFDSVVRASCIMRTRITYVANRPFQVVVREQIPWNVYQSREEYEASQTPAMGPNKRLVYPALVGSPGGEGECALILTIHHALYDGHSLSLFWQQVESAYRSLPLRITPFNRFLKHTLRPNHSDEFWRAQFENLEAPVFPALPWPGYVPRPDATFSWRIAAPSVVGSEHTIATMVRLAWAILQAYYTDSTDVLYGVTANGRTAALAGIEQMNGPTVCTFPLRVGVDENATISTVLSRLQLQAASIMQHEQTGLQYIQKCSDNAARACAFQTHLAIQSSSEGVDNQLLRQRKRWNWRMFASYGLVIVCDLNLGGDRGVIDCTVYHDPAQVADGQARQMMPQFEHILHHIASHPTQSIRDIPGVGPQDRKRLALWNSALPSPSTALVYASFLSYAQSDPSAAAVSAWDGELTYGELASQSLQASESLSQWGVGSGKIVPVCFEKSKWAVVAMLAVLRAGAAVALIDPRHPSGRIQQILQQLEPCVILAGASTQSIFADNSTTVLTPPFTSLPRHMHTTSKHSSVNEPRITPENHAFILFTSGSTGEPKGIIMEHRHLATGIDHHGPKMRIHKGARALHFSSYAFDLSLCEIFTVLSSGACICVPSEHDRLNQIERFVQKHRVNWMILSPSVIRTLDPDQLPRVETIVLAGETVSQDIVSHWASRVTLINAYGPAETTIAVAAGELCADDWEPGTIGPMMGAAGWITVPSDPSRLVPIGAVGELVVEGPVVTRGYLGRPDQTAAAYIDPPPWLLEFRGGSPGRVYRTGDLVRYTPDGHICFLGRKDTLVKLHGQRIELAEVEYHARRCFEGRDVIAETLPTPGSNEQFHATLIVFVVDEMARSDELLCLPSTTFLGLSRLAEAQLAELLPPYMVPSTFIPISHLPLTMSGKTDRSRVRRAATLLSFDQMKAYSTVTPGLHRIPSTETEEALRTVWASVLKKDPDVIGVDDSFFRLGGDSITAMLVVSQGQSAGLTITVEDIFEQKTISRLCAGRPGLDREGHTQPLKKVLENMDQLPPGLVASLTESGLTVAAAYPCSPIQQGIALSQAKKPGLYMPRFSSMVFAKGHQGVVDVARLMGAWQQVVRRHPLLRSILVEANGSMIQVVLDGHEPDVALVEANSTDVMATLARCPPVPPAVFRPSHRLTICRNATGETAFLLEASHVLLDGISERILRRDLQLAYDGGLDLQPVHVYQEYVSFIMGHNRADAQAYWETYLAGVTPCLFPSLTRCPEDGVRRLSISLPRTRELALFCQAQDITVATVFQVAWAMVVRIYTGSEDVCFGYLTAGRDVPIHGINNAVGAFINMLVCRVVFGPDTTLAGLLQTRQGDFARCLRFQHLSLAEISHLVDKQQRSPLFNSFVSIQTEDFTGPAHEQSTLSFGDTHVSGPTEYNVSLHVTTGSDGIRIGFNSDRAVLNDYQANEVLTIILDWNEKALPALGAPSATTTVHDAIQQISLRQPSLPAVCAWDGDFSYAEIDDLSTLLAEPLIHRGVGRGDFVAICFEKSRWTIIAMLGVLKAGGGLILLDPSQPLQRLQQMCKTSQVALVVSSESTAGISALLGPPIVTLGDQSRPWNEPKGSMLQKQHPNPPLPSDAPLYAVFTSGSTGAPKGAVIEQQGFLTNANALITAHGLTPSSRVLQFASYAWDMSLFELFITLLCGGCICVPSEHERLQSLSQAVSQMRANVFIITPTLARTLDPKQFLTIESVIMIGERVLAKDVSMWQDQKVMIAYGPAECTMISSMVRCEGRQNWEAYIGSPLGCRFWVVDPSNHHTLLPIGAVGELLIEGPNVCRGYLRDPERTSEVFLRERPLCLQEIAGSGTYTVYKTGDHVRYLDDGNLVYITRKDTQVKVHGQRFELGDVEYHIRQVAGGYPDVVVEVVGQDLIAFFSPCGDHGQESPSGLFDSPTTEFQCQAEALKDRLCDVLPSYMVPTLFVPLRRLPLNASGKIDRRTLRNEAASLRRGELRAYVASRTARVSPSTDNEAMLCKIWAEVIGIPSEALGIDDHFFRVGGHSILAMKVMSMVEERGRHITMADIFNNPLLRDMASKLTGTSAGNTQEVSGTSAPFSLLDCTDPCAMIQQAAEICDVSIQDIDDIYPCTALQEGLMALSVKTPGHYVSSREFRLKENVDPQRFMAAWDTAVTANAILRTRIVQLGDGGTYQVVVRHSSPWRYVESSETAVDKHITMMTPGRPLMLCSLRDINGSDPRFTLTIHHALYDAWSMSILWDQVQQAYNGHHIASVSYKHFLDHIGRHHEEAKVFWRQRLSGLEALPFPILCSPGSLPRPNSSLVHAVPCSGYDKGDHTMSTIIQLAWSLVISHHTGSHDVVFGLTLDGRRASVSGIQRITGPTITTVPLRVQLKPQETVGQSLVSLQHGITAMIPFEQLGLQTIRKLGGEPASACDFQFQLIIQPASRTEGENTLVTGGKRTHNDSYAFSSYALVAICYLDDPLPGDITVHLKYDEKLLAPISVQRLANQFHHMIAQVCQGQGLQLASLDVLNEQDTAELVEWNSYLPKSCNICLHELILAQSVEHPNATAIDAWDGSFTYKELSEQAHSLSWQLQRLGVSHGSRVALCFNRSKWVVVAMLAVLRAGGCCVPLDPTHPRERIRDIVHRTNALRLLTDGTHHASLSQCGAPVLTIPLPEMPNGSSTEQNDSHSPSPDSVAFIMFTSGSTGRPKGAVVNHGNISTAVREHQHLLNLGPSTRAAHLASYAFDVSLAEILYPLASGGCICIPSEQDRIANLAHNISLFRINCVFMVPSVLNAFLSPDQVPGLQTLILAGEPMSRKVMETWSARVALFNAYGPTESTIFCAIGRVPESGWFPGTIGRAAGCVAWITEPDNPSRLMPIGTVGELLVEGPTVTAGYLDDPAETATAYIEPPAWRAQFGETPGGSRLYRTGDLVKYDADGLIQFISRGDTQVKIRGQRIELAEIEYHATECFPHVCDVVAEVVPQGNGASGPNLIGFVAITGSLIDEDNQKLILPPTDKFRAQAQEAITGLKRRLPRYMVPSSFLPIAMVPRSISGKINRRLLRAEAGTLTMQDIQGYSMPHSLARRQATTEPELALRRLWADVLGVPVDGIHADDGFFHLGGDSVTAMKLSSAARTAGLALLVVDVFAHPILADLAQTLERSSQSVIQENLPYTPGCLVGDTDVCSLASRLVRSPAAFTPTSVEDVLPATAFQTSCLDGDNIMYIWLQFSNNVDLDCLERACQGLADHRSILRTAFISSPDGYLQVVLDKINLPAVHLHCQGDIDGFMQSVCCKDRTEATVLGAPLFKVYIISQHGSGPRLVMRLSHAQYDGTFLGQLFRDLSAAYDDRPPSPSPLTFSRYLHYRHSTSPADRGLFWATYLQGSQMTNLTPAGPSVQNSRCMEVHPAVAQREIPLPMTRDGFTVASLSQTTWAYVLAQLTGEKDVVFGTVLNGRDSPFPHMDQVAGPCLAILPIRISINPTWNTDRLVRHVQDQHVQIMPYASTDLRDIQQSVPGYASVAKFGSTFNHLKSGTMAPPRIGGADCQWGTTCVEGAAAFLRPSSNFLVRTTKREGTLRIYMCSWEKGIGPEVLEDIADRFVESMKVVADDYPRELFL
ncbi:non-ribosomal peptide synthetase [Aspergillus puulaauensis]|uniref:Non-ribosomal peptide synthetase n=1 Tax=Aspergillus puulaauensis TaxID=1220207 RepID=A0A7R7XXN3_9EURO|nr:non-ribosomal peptide synthetase [Aspergillus puulaauensis]BCS29626.1 non-ribosomal peptide synthetase [Aspergillus puulaauensis]